MSKRATFISMDGSQRYDIAVEEAGPFEFYDGSSGTGKTTCLLYRQLMKVEDGGKVISIAIHGAGQRDLMMKKLQTSYDAVSKTIKIVDGMTLPFLLGDIDKNGVGLANMLAKVANLTPTREAATAKAASKAIAHGAFERNSLGAVLSKYLTYIDNDASKNAQNTLEKIFDGIEIMNGDFDFEKPILELNFDGILMERQVILAEFVLQVILSNAMQGRFKNEGLTVVVDECQCLEYGKGSALRNLLEEGRKQNVSVLLAAPEIPLNNRSKLYWAAQHCGTVAYFKPAPVECKKLADILDRRNADDWAIELNTLGRGEFVLSGNFKNQNGLAVKGPIMAKMCDDFLQEDSGGQRKN